MTSYDRTYFDVESDLLPDETLPQHRHDRVRPKRRGRLIVAAVVALVVGIGTPATLALHPHHPTNVQPIGVPLP